MSVPVIFLNSSPERCCEVPLPADANASSPGFALARAINSFTFFTGVDGLTTSRFGSVAIRMIGAKSLFASYGMFGYKLGLIAWVATVPINIV